MTYFRLFFRLFTMFNLLLGKTWRIWKVVVSASFNKVKVPQRKV